MCFSSKKKRENQTIQNRLTGDPIKFEKDQIDELHKKFSKIAGSNSSINRQAFMKNMGILGLQAAQCFSDRLFNSFDIDNDNKISFQDFLEYMQVLKSGNEKSKARISFKLIDLKNKNKIDQQDFKTFLDDFFRSWSQITNIPITATIKTRLDNYVKLIFSKVSRDRQSNDIDFKYYADTIYKDREFIQAFDFITQGVATLFMSENTEILKQNSTSYILYRLIGRINYLYDTVFQMKTKESSVFQKLNKQQYPNYVPSMKIKRMKKNFEQNQTEQQLSYSDVSLKQMSNKINNLTIQNIPTNQTNNINKSKATQLSELYTIRQSKYNKTIQKTADTIQIHHCQNCSLLERKLAYLEKQLKDIVENSQIQQTYSTLYEEIKKDEEKQKNIKKKYAVKNVHGFERDYDDMGLFVRSPQQGNMIFFGDENWNLVLNMMIGIQMAVRSVKGYQQIIYEQPKDFNLKYNFELVPRRFGNQTYHETIYSFTDYAPNTFNHIRKLFHIDNQQYIVSIGPNKLMASLMLGEMSTMTQLTSQGKSGSFFYYTADGNYMLKTIHDSQYRFLRKILADYYHYLKKNPKSLITRFYGLHQLQQKDEKGKVIRKIYFVIMGNVFNINQRIYQRYDIKGSSYGRQTTDDRPNITKKDNDFKKRQPLLLSMREKLSLMQVIRKDAEFFADHNIIDYSLLIGVVNRKKLSTEKSIATLKVIPDNLSCSSYSSNASAFVGQTKIYGHPDQEAYIFGIIDILTQYSSKKSIQYYWKRSLYGNGISAIPPEPYKDRFIDFIKNVVFQE